MRKTHCSHLWEVEAERDGRLSGEAREAFARHLASCEACTHERRSLEQLALDLRQEEATDDLTLRRLRHKVLEAADASRLAPISSPPPARRGILVAVGLGLAVASATAFVVRHHPVEEAPPAAHIKIEPIGGNARWARNVTNQVERVELSDGALSFDVSHRTGGERLVVSTPDGEIEDVGTAFRVTVASGRTSEIAVTDGRVIFHRLTGGDVELVAGMRWTDERPASSAVVAAAPARPPAVVAPAPKPRAAASAPTRDEDSAYLRVVTLVREGRVDEARAAARTYLRVYPDGFRRTEVQAIVADGE